MNLLRAYRTLFIRMSEEIPIVSIIIPCFNYAHFLPTTIESALGQTYNNCEIIVVDDGSTDNTAEVAQNFGDSVKYIYQENAGLSAARNTGIKNAKGEYMVFLDSDDMIKQQMVATSMDAIERLGDGFGIVASTQTWIDKEGKAIDIPNVFPVEECEITALDLLIRNRFPVTSLVSSKVFEQCGLFDEELKSSEDRDMWVRAAVSGIRIVRLKGSLFIARRHGNNMSSDGLMQAKSIKRVQDKALAGGALTGWSKIYRLKVRSYYLYQKGIMRSGKQPMLSCFRILASIVLWPVFGGLESLGEKRWFRIKMIAWTLLRVIRGKP